MLPACADVYKRQVYYGVIQAIKGISFEVNEGEVIALIGANGAGKTTTLQTSGERFVLQPITASITYHHQLLTHGCFIRSLLVTVCFIT